MATIQLTDSGLKKLIKDSEEARMIGSPAQNSFSDGGGLSLMRQHSGSWLWFYRYRFNGKPSRLSLGAYPLITLAMARAAHKVATGVLNDGLDPAAQRLESKAAAKVEAANTFKAVALMWFDNWRIGKNINAQHAQATWRRLELDVFPHIGLKPIHSLTLKTLAPMFQGIETRTTSIAEKAWVACSQVFRHACALGIIDTNPLAQVKRGDLLHTVQIVEHHPCVPPHEIPALMRNIDEYKGVLARLALQLMALVFVRHKELRYAEWCEFDMNAKTWTIPSHRMKSVKGGATPHIVPLSHQAVAIIEQLRTINGGRVHLFPSTKGEDKVMSDGTMNKALEQMGYKGVHVVHGFRSMASTALHEQGYDHAHIELQLAHLERNKVSAAYNHATYLPQRTIMMQDWADFLDAQREAGKVIKMKA